MHASQYDVQGPLAAAVIPHGRCDDAPIARDARHLAQPCHGIGHEVDDELRERGVELVVGERQLLGRRALDRDSRVAFPDGVDERLGWIDGRDGFLAEPMRTSSAVSAPGPQPTSSTRPSAPAKSANSGPSGTEYRPMNLSYASAATAKRHAAESTRSADLVELQRHRLV